MLAMVIAFRNVGLLRHFTVAIQEATASASQWVPAAIVLCIGLASAPSFPLNTSVKHGKIKFKAVLVSNRKRNAMKVMREELAANHA